MLAFSYLVALPLVAATWHYPPVKPPVCGTVTATCTKTTYVPSDVPVTSSCTVWGNCYNTVTRTDPNCATAWVTSTTTATRTPTTWVTATPTRTSTCTSWTTTKKCLNNWKKDGIPEELTNAERIKMGLPIRSPAEEKRWFLKPPPAKSCTPTTVTSTAWITRTTPHVVTSTSTKCRFTRTTLVPNTSTYTRTSTTCVTTNGPPVTRTQPCATWATTTVVATRNVPGWC